MKDKQKHLITFLLKQDKPVSAKVTAASLNISPRTVKNYVKEINELSSGVIQSSNSGYLIDKDLGRKLVSESQNEVNEMPETFTERSNYYLREALIQKRSLNLFQLENELFISESTIRQDIARMNKTYGNADLQFCLRGEEFVIEGNEKERRRLISLLVFEEMPNHFIDLAILAEHFDPADIEIIATAITEVTEESRYSLNEFAYTNLVLHLLILVDSIRHHHTLVARETSSVWLEKEKALLVNQLIDRLEVAFSIKLNPSEREELHVLFQANANFVPTNNLAEVEEIVGTILFEQIREIAAEIQETFGISLTDRSFIVPFSLHLSGLIARGKENSFIKNPMVNTIKKDYPIVFTVAVAIAIKLEEFYPFSVTEDEVAYIAMHIAFELENQQQNLYKIRTVLLCPKYMKLDVELYQYLNDNFSHELNIISVISQLSEIQQEEFDLLITTLEVPLSLSQSYQVLPIAPILNRQQKRRLTMEIAELRTYQKRRILLDNFTDFFQEKFCYFHPDVTEKHDLIQLICGNFTRAEIVSESFFEQVLEREQAASTAYDGIAIPHSIHSAANQTKIALAFLKKPLDWGGQKISLVILPAISKHDKKLFFNIYEALISFFDDPAIYPELLKINSYEKLQEFIQQQAKM
ncbi:BglG family transcription antiterminator [Enterococcus sp. LJL90]